MSGGLPRFIGRRRGRAKALADHSPRRDQRCSPSRQRLSGATRQQILRQFAIDGLVLAAAGAIVGLPLAYWTQRFLW